MDHVYISNPSATPGAALANGPGSLTVQGDSCGLVSILVYAEDQEHVASLHLEAPDVRQLMRALQATLDLAAAGRADGA
jgi:hypothetical protein